MRLIDADEFCNEMKIRQDAAYKHSKGSDSSEFRFTESDLWDRVICGFVEAKLVMDSIPTVDAVPVVRCKDCKYLSMTTLGMPYACWHKAEGIWGQDGTHANDVVCTSIDDIEHYCVYGERKTDGNE